MVSSLSSSLHFRNFSKFGIYFAINLKMTFETLEQQRKCDPQKLPETADC